jgi:hypothetical protein
LRTCPACGESVDDLVCPTCGRSSGGDSALPAGPDDLEYDFDDVTADERVEASDLLAKAGIPYRWDPGYVLRVAPGNEEEVDALFGHEPEETAALASLRTCASALAADPTDEDAIVELADATGVVTTAEPPEGVNRILWSTAGYLARQVLDLAGEVDVDEDDVVVAATALARVLA